MKSFRPHFVYLHFILFSFALTSAQEITLFDDAITYRYYQDQKRISYKEVGELMKKDSIAQMNWKRAKVKNTLANVFLIVELSALPITVLSENPNAGVFYSLLLGGAIGSITFAISRQKSKRRAILRYNSLFDSPKKIENVNQTNNQHLPPSIAKPKIKGINNHHGTGICIQF